MDRNMVFVYLDRNKINSRSKPKRSIYYVFDMIFTARKLCVYLSCMLSMYDIIPFTGNTQQKMRKHARNHKDTRHPFVRIRIIFNPVWIRNCIHCKVWDELLIHSQTLTHHGPTRSPASWPESVERPMALTRVTTGLPGSQHAYNPHFPRTSGHWAARSLD